MNQEVGNESKMDDLETSALAISGTIIVFFVVYWIIQIDSVRQLLNLAYG